MTKKEEINKIFKRFKGLKQYRSKTAEELLILAEKKYKENLINLDSLVTNTEEKKAARKLLNKYLEAYDIEKPAERNDLVNLIYLEAVLLPRFRERLNADKDEKYVPLKLIETLQKVIDQIGILKNKLGFNEQEERHDPLKVLNTLKKRFNKYILENRNDFTMKCPHCLKYVLLRRRTKDMIAGKHPFLKNNVLYNKPLFDLVVQKKITIEEAAQVLSCSPDYISWVIAKHYSKESNGRETDGRGN